MTSPSSANDQTPLMQQHRRLKERYPDALLFFRVGDFYELFEEDALKGSQLLNIALTSRDKHRPNPTPLCGVPAVAVTSYVAKLIRAGQAVAICEQLDSPGPAGRTPLMAREVVRVITPGTVLEPALLDPKSSAFVGAVAQIGRQTGAAWVDLSTGQGWVSGIDGPRPQDEVAELFRQWNVKELLLPSGTAMLPAWRDTLTGLRLVDRPADAFTPDTGLRLLHRHFHVESLAAWGGSDDPAVLGAVGALLQYLEETQLQALSHLRALRSYRRERFLSIDPTTQAHLELTERSAAGTDDGRRDGTLLGVIDRTMTAMGGRLLRHWLLHPLLDAGDINQRLDRVEAFTADYERRAALRTVLGGVGDLERIISRVSLNAANARDLVQLKESIDRLPDVWKLLNRHPEEGQVGQPLSSLTDKWDDLKDLVRMIDAALVDAPPLALKEGGLIKPGHHAELDELRDISRNGKQWIAQLEGRERQRTGIDSLKVRYNQVFGYFIEVSKANLARVPDDFHRKQTLVNAERFITPELKELESKVLGAEERICQLEYQLYNELRGRIAGQAARVQEMAERLAEIDTLAALGDAAVAGRYTRPVLSDGVSMTIRGGRHPVVEQALGPNRFVPNDIRLNDSDHTLLIITGPNMAGKSTYLRQVAHIVILAQMGSFVPAEAAEIGLVDGIFTRIGATDDLVGGRSTFMVEMNETAAILQRATPRSLILLDEVGRGTSTFDGVSIAWAVAEHLYRVIGARTLFATHYHELTELSHLHEGIKACHVAVREWNNEIVFLRTIVEGGSDRSYGIQVARLAGLPESVIATAKNVLARLEAQGGTIAPADTSRPAMSPPPQTNLFDSPLQQIVDELAALDPNHMTPMQALDVLEKIKRKASTF
ncbi:MAG TPA: DNA mismatch repair protein MutS [Nitrospiria bacterium]|nr:DNA mismatch repair protein MutS [Nitrospiria bacterium]